jgi:hypothetical protein
MADSAQKIGISDFEKVQSAGAGASGEVWLAEVKRDLPFAKAGQNVSEGVQG